MARGRRRSPPLERYQMEVMVMTMMMIGLMNWIEISSSREILNGRAGRRSQLLCPQCHHQLCQAWGDLGYIAAHSRAREEPTPFPQCRSQLSTSGLSSTWGECHASLDGIAVSLFANCIRRQYVLFRNCNLYEVGPAEPWKF